MPHTPLKILVANGVNLDLLGTRQPEIYGSRSLEDLRQFLEGELKALEVFYKLHAISLEFFQTNNECAFLEKISGPWDGAIINPGAWTHTSLALGDRLAALNKPFVEVHLSKLATRESFRQHSYVSAYALGVVSGLGFDSYAAGLFAIVRYLREKNFRQEQHRI